MVRPEKGMSESHPPRGAAHVSGLQVGCRWRCHLEVLARKCGFLPPTWSQRVSQEWIWAKQTQSASPEAC